MASSAAHDISNPLATITACAQAILAFWPGNERGSGIDIGSIGEVQLPDGSPAQQFREDLELIVAEAKRAGDIVSNLLTFARDEDPQWYPVSIAILVRQVISLTRHHLNQRSVSIESNTLDPEFGTPDWSWIHGDAGHLRQVIINLIINAEQAIRSVKECGIINIQLERDDRDHLRLSVEDDGPGIPPDLHRRIFEAFFTTKTNGEGTGLGLAIATGIISRHRGQLDVADRGSGGASFSVRLPVTTIPEGLGVASPTKAERSELSSRRGSVLLVDDEPGIRRSVGRFLRRFGCEVETVATGNEAITALSAKQFDAVVSDLRMPGLSGEELFQVLEKMYPHMTERIVFTSGDMMRPETRAFLKQCGRPSLQKPYELGDLVRILDRLWSDGIVPPPTV